MGQAIRGTATTYTDVRKELLLAVVKAQPMVLSKKAKKTIMPKIIPHFTVCADILRALAKYIGKKRKPASKNRSATCQTGLIKERLSFTATKERPEITAEKSKANLAA